MVMKIMGNALRMMCKCRLHWLSHRRFPYPEYDFTFSEFLQTIHNQWIHNSQSWININQFGRDAATRKWGKSNVLAFQA